VIHHLSLPAHNPLRVAQVLAEILNAAVVPFTVHPGGYIVLTLDQHGTTIEVYPAGTEMIPGDDQEQGIFSHNPTTSNFTATHVAISVPISQQEIEAIAAREGWRILHCSRNGLFDVIEFWLENRVQLELLPPVIAAQHVAFMQPENLRASLEAAGIPILKEPRQEVPPKPLTASVV
jgi:hypothetical protein